MSDKEGDYASNVLATLKTATANTADMKERGAAALDMWGGVSGLMRACKDTFHDAETPQSVKTRILTAMLDIVRDTHKLEPPEHNQTQLTDKELLHAIRDASRELGLEQPTGPASGGLEQSPTATDAGDADVHPVEAD